MIERPIHAVIALAVAALAVVATANAAETRMIPLVVPGTEFVAVEPVPGIPASYNDFCVFQDDHQVWHLFGISTNHPAPGMPPSLLHATARQFKSTWERQPYIDLGEMHNWAPWIIRDRQRPSKCAMLVGGKKWETIRSYEADTGDLSHWTLRKDLGHDFGGRDPMIHFDEKTRQYYLYATLSSFERGNEGIAVSVSKDLDHWQRVHLIPPSRSPACDESPFVVMHDGWYYLWATVSSIHYYRGIPTRIFRSKYADFRDLVDTTAEHAIYSLPMHAVEIVEVGDQMWIGQTGHYGPGVVFSRIRWAAEGKTQQVDLEKISWKGKWESDKRRAASQPGDSFECRFRGGRIEWRGNKSPSGGRADIYLDDKKVGTADQYGYDKSAPGKEYREAFLWCSDDMPEGPHVLRMVICDDKHPKSQGRLITVSQVAVTEFAGQSETGGAASGVTEKSSDGRARRPD